MTDTHGLLLEVRDEITRIHYTEVKPHGLMYHEPGARPNLCTSCALIARIDAALAQQAPAEQRQEPVAWALHPDCINELQQESIARLVKRCKQAHYVDVHIRINGKWEVEQADWIKHLIARPPSPAQNAGAATRTTTEAPNAAEAQTETRKP